MSKILIVEDEEAIADLEKDYLELSGFEVEIEHDGSRGLERALNEEFDLYVLDLMLPGVDGFEICKRIREVKNTPILMVSAKKDDIDKIRGLGLGGGRLRDEAIFSQRAGGAGESAPGQIRAADRHDGPGKRCDRDPRDPY